MSALSIKSLVSFGDLTDEDIDEILELADGMASAIGFDDDERISNVQPLDRILATAFYEPSTRTRLSFEAAMLRLGGQVVGFASADVSSAYKGESVADTARVLSGYCDVLVMRHPLAGAAKVAAKGATVPFINAGDGPREHPTQTLTDLFCINRELDTLSDLTIGLCGDLKYGRTVHSLAPVMARRGCEIVCIAPDELKMPEKYMVEVEELGGSRPEETDDLEAAIADLDVLYMTRIQRERFDSQEDYERVAGVYVLTPDIMEKAKDEMRVLHPLPRVDEIDPAVDEDPRAAYFRQAAGGVPVRMALISLLLDLPQFSLPPKSIGLDSVGRSRQKEDVTEPAPPPEPQWVTGAGPCRNKKCIAGPESNEPLEQKFYEDAGGNTVCYYCEQPLETD
ncbi:MAG: aspartate carbamoyltransferase [Armatimonadota bacterium]